MSEGRNIETGRTVIEQGVVGLIRTEGIYKVYLDQIKGGFDPVCAGLLTEMIENDFLGLRKVPDEN